MSDWKWFGHAGHLIVGYACRFHLCTLIGEHLVSTVGEYWPEREVREIHAKVYDPGWLKENRHLNGDTFDAAYMKRFGYEDIGCDRKYETMVFKVSGKTCTAEDCNCGMPTIIPDELDFAGYNAAGSAMTGHYTMCEKGNLAAQQAAGGSAAAGSQK